MAEYKDQCFLSIICITYNPNPTIKKIYLQLLSKQI